MADSEPKGCDVMYDAKLTVTIIISGPGGACHDITTVNYFKRVKNALGVKNALDTLITSKLTENTNPDSLIKFSTLVVDDEDIELSSSVVFRASAYRGHRSVIEEYSYDRGGYHWTIPGVSW